MPDGLLGAILQVADIAILVLILLVVLYVVFTDPLGARR